MESRIIYHVEKFIAFLFGEETPYDPKQRIYNKLLRLDGEELEVWMNEILKKYITGSVAYEDLRLEEIDGYIKFRSWYQYHISIGSTYVMDVEEIYGSQKRTNFDLHCAPSNFYYLASHQHNENLEEYQELKSTIPKYKYRNPSSQIEFMESYLEMYIMGKSSDDLKSYIIQLVEPIEIR